MPLSPQFEKEPISKQYSSIYKDLKSQLTRVAFNKTKKSKEVVIEKSNEIENKAQEIDNALQEVIQNMQRVEKKHHH
jgi:virulence-associated protein VapD